MRGLTYLSIAATACMLSGCEKYALDRQMEELCKKDGGVKVYETVKISAKLFDTTGRLITGPTQNRGGGLFTEIAADRYQITSKHDVIKDGNPFANMLSEGRLLRHQIIVRRIADEKILGEEVSYSRTGGDITFGHPSQNFCPRPRPQPGIIQATLLKEE